MSDNLSRKSLFGSDQHLTEEGIAAYTEVLLHGADENALSEVKAHIDACEACHREVVELYGLMATMPSETEREEPEEEEKDTKKSGPSANVPRMHPAWRWALVALTALLAFLVYRNTRQQTLPVTPAHQTPTPGQLLNPQAPERPIAKTAQPENITPPTEQPDLYAANFEPSEQLEGLVGETLRGAGAENPGPVDGQVFKPGSAVRFQWTPQTTESIQLILTDNRGKELLRQEALSGSFEWKSLKRPGLYYWKLETSEELLHVGKFLLK